MNEKALNNALKYLTIKDRTGAEMQTYLKRKEYSTQDIKEVLEYLVEMNYINDNEYAIKYSKELCTRGNGSGKVKNELVKKGISGEIIKQVMAESDDFDIAIEKEKALEQAKKIILNNFDELKISYSDDFETKKMKYKAQQQLKGKIGRRLISKGYSQDIVFLVINDICKEYL